MGKRTSRFQKKPLKAELSIFRNFLGIIEKQTQDFLNASWSDPTLLKYEYFRDSLVALAHITTRVINKVKEIEERLEREGG